MNMHRDITDFHKILWICIFFGSGFLSCNSSTENEFETNSTIELIVLGTTQDAGSPQIGCKKECCKKLFLNPVANRMVSSLGLIDKRTNKSFLFDATPDIAQQLKYLQKSSKSTTEVPDGIFLTHAHIGHYTGLMYFGKESMNSDSVVTYTMPRMTNFLANNGPWNQLVNNKNIKLIGIENKTTIQIGDSLSVTPIQVPHRDEYSETVGYIITGPNKSALYIPDIDKWQNWEESIIAYIKQVDYAFLDGTFYDGKEINHRDISEIPHPFVIESMKFFKTLSKEDKSKIHFIHLNHTNPLLNHGNNAAQVVKKEGFNTAKLYSKFPL